MLKEIRNILSTREFQLIVYKGLYDTMLYLMIAMFLCLVIESAIPRMVSENNGFLIISFLIFANLLAILSLGKKLGVSFKSKRHFHALPIAIFFAFVLVGNSLLKFSLLENLIITTLTILVMIFLYQIIFLSKD